MEAPSWYADRSMVLCHKKRATSWYADWSTKLVRRWGPRVGTQFATICVPAQAYADWGPQVLVRSSPRSVYASDPNPEPPPPRLEPRPVRTSQPGARPRTQIAICLPGVIIKDTDARVSLACFWGAASAEGRKHGRREGDTVATESSREMSFMWHHRGSLHRAIIRAFNHCSASINFADINMVCFFTTTHSLIPSAVRKAASQTHILSCSPVREAVIPPSSGFACKSCLPTLHTPHLKHSELYPPNMLMVGTSRWYALAYNLFFPTPLLRGPLDSDPDFSLNHHPHHHHH